ncbi:hypothetical protein NDU88_002583 [Pleurodeles waltl]|uniref:Uncharacterized protein n=1 Tax=Pleurodeles waltl TaxID=8319 RepID=A0AAV7UBA2_PLEWA|nr:hypothetical protein NDU88_002583 [Pleurodeles waltl]
MLLFLGKLKVIYKDKTDFFTTPKEVWEWIEERHQLRPQLGPAEKVNDVLCSWPTRWSSAKNHRERYSKPVNKFQKTMDRLEVEKTPPSDVEGDVGMGKQQSALKEEDNKTTWSQLEKAAELDYIFTPADDVGEILRADYLATGLPEHSPLLVAMGQKTRRSSSSWHLNAWELRDAVTLKEIRVDSEIYFTWWNQRNDL